MTIQQLRNWEQAQSPKLTELLADARKKKRQWSEAEIRNIQEKVCAAFEINFVSMMGETRCREFVYPRHIAMFLCRHLTGASLPTIAKAFRRDHSSVIHAITNIQSILYRNPNYRAIVDKLLVDLNDQHIRHKIKLQEGTKNVSN